MKLVPEIQRLIPFILSILICTGSFAQQGAGHGTIPAAERQRLLGVVPSPLPARAKLQGAPVFYASSNLYEYMDGGADIFQLYDVQALLHAEYRAGEVDLTADIFDMGTAENAFGMYSSERSPQYTFFPIGAEGYRNEGIVNFFQDRYYVKLVGFGEGADALLNEFAQAVSKRIEGGRTLPAIIERLPAEGRKAHSEQFIRKDPIGHPFLSPAYQAVYTRGESESTLLVSVGTDAADAQARMKSLSDHFRSGGQVQPAPEFGEGAVRASNSYEGTLIARTSGRYLILLINPGTGADGMFKDAAARLQ